MFDQSGVIAVVVNRPSGDARHAATSTNSPPRRSTFLRRMLPSVAESDPGIIMKNEVPFAIRSLAPKKNINAGTTPPPPAPSTCERMPVTMAAATSADHVHVEELERYKPAMRGHVEYLASLNEHSDIDSQISGRKPRHRG